MTLFNYLMEKNFLLSNTRALCVGESSSSAVLALRHFGLSDSFGVEHRYVYELNFEDRYFDFVFTKNLHPALVVTEIERILKPGGKAAMLVPIRISSAKTFVSFLKSSDIIHSCTVGPYSLIILEKRTEKFAKFEHFKLPEDCPSIALNKPFMNHIEPLGETSSGLTYLPEFVNISSRNKLVYINIGAGEFARTSIEKISKLYPMNHTMSFDKFVVHYISSITQAYIPEPGINLVLYQPPGEESERPEIFSTDEFMEGDDFNLMSWIKATASGGNFVILLMNAKQVELNILEELFKSGGICYVDELFLRCPADADCMETLKSLRRSGVYVHERFI